MRYHWSDNCSMVRGTGDGGAQGWSSVGGRRYRYSCPTTVKNIAHEFYIKLMNDGEKRNLIIGEFISTNRP